MRKVLKIILIIGTIILVKLIITFSINEIVIFKYKKNNYDTSLVKSLYILNFSEAYIPYYNHANILYKEGKYNEAIINYEKALDRKPPQKKICDIRINLSLATIKMIDTKNSQEALEKLKEAKENLYKDHCADSHDKSGESMTAEELEEEIKKLEENIDNQEEDSNTNDNNNQSDDNNQDEQNDEYSEIEKQIRENQKKSQESRQEDLQRTDNLNNFDFYYGKRW